MNVTWQEIPSADTDPGDAPPSAIRALADKAVNRRTVMRSATALGMTLGVTVLGWVVPGAARRAEATPGSYWGNCNIYNYDGILCLGGPYSSGYCGGDGWFLNGNFSGYRWEPVTRCNGRNAWIWDTGSVGWRCCDGMRYPLGGGAGTFLICSAVAYRH